MEADLAELKELSEKRHEDLLSLLAVLPLLLPENTPGLPVSLLFLLSLKVAIFKHCSDWWFVYF